MLISSPGHKGLTEARSTDDKQSTGDHPSRRLESGYLGILDNNQVNFLMALIMSAGAITFNSILRV